MRADMCADMRADMRADIHTSPGESHRQVTRRSARHRLGPSAPFATAPRRFA